MANVDNLTTNLKERNEEVRINVVESLVSCMSKELSALDNDSYKVYIHRVPEKYRKFKEEAYTPLVVSVGPLHHGKKQLQAMEAYKLRYLQLFISESGISLVKLFEYATEMEASVRSCYEDTSHLRSDEFLNMILLDGIFVVQLFVKNLTEMRDRGDMLFENKWLASDLMHDMLLLENQLPLNFIMGLYEFVDTSRVQHMSFYEVSLVYFKGVESTRRLQLVDGYEYSRHLVEFLVILHGPSVRKTVRIYDRFGHTRSACELQAAGVRFNNSMGNLFDVSFKSGVLKLPQLTVNDKTETFFRNLIAFEQGRHHVKHITNYIIFMDGLIKTVADVELLVKHRIIENFLGESQLVANLFNNLYKEVGEEQRDFYFADMWNELEGYSKDYIHILNHKWFKLKLILKKKYVISINTVLVLTFIQTVCTIVGLITKR